MEQKLYAVKIIETIDMGSRNYSSSRKSFSLSELKKGERLNDGYEDLEVVGLDDEKFVFNFKGRRITLYRYWQVYGTGSYGISNPMVQESCRYLFYFASDEKSKESQFDRLQQLFNEMCDNDNEGFAWKNIPLAKEGLHLMKDVAPKEDDDDDLKTQFCELVVNRELIDATITPRLLLSYMELWHAEKGSTYYWNDETYRLQQLTDPKLSADEKIDIMKGTKHLLYDPIQLTPEWEDLAYEMEKDYSERTQGMKRYRGSCHEFWEIHKKVYNRYGFNWKTPQQMNPNVHFD